MSSPTEQSPPSSPQAAADRSKRRSRAASTYTIPRAPPAAVGRYRDGGTQTERNSDISPALTIAETLYAEGSHADDAPKTKQLDEETYNILNRPATKSSPTRPPTSRKVSVDGKRRSLINRMSGLERIAGPDDDVPPMPPAFSMVDGSIFIDFSPNPRLSFRADFEKFGPVQEVNGEQSDIELMTSRGGTAAGEVTDSDEKTPEMKKPEVVYIEGWKLWSVMLSLTAASFLILLDNSIVVTAIPKITSDFHSLGDIGWYGSAYSLTSGCLQPLTGKLYTYLHAKVSFILKCDEIESETNVFDSGFSSDSLCCLRLVLSFVVSPHRLPSSLLAESLLV